MTSLAPTKLVDVRDVELRRGYSEPDDMMRVVMEVNEDPPDLIEITMTKDLQVSLDRIVLKINIGSDVY